MAAEGPHLKQQQSLTRYYALQSRITVKWTKLFFLQKNVNTEKSFVITSLDNPDIIMAVKSFDRFEQLNP
jgi:hypothetical protein